MVYSFLAFRFWIKCGFLLHAFINLPKVYMCVFLFVFVHIYVCVCMYVRPEENHGYHLRNTIHLLWNRVSWWLDTSQWVLGSSCLHLPSCGLTSICLHIAVELKASFLQSQTTTSRNGFSPSTVWVLGLHSCQQAWWEVPLPAKPSTRWTHLFPLHRTGERPLSHIPRKGRKKKPSDVAHAFS